jgi:hypothetical protein
METVLPAGGSIMHQSTTVLRHPDLSSNEGKKTRVRELPRFSRFVAGSTGTTVKRIHVSVMCIRQPPLNATESGNRRWWAAMYD